MSVACQTNTELGLHYELQTIPKLQTFPIFTLKTKVLDHWNSKGPILPEKLLPVVWDTDISN